MKIYCARRSSSDKDIIDSFVGKDAWVRVIGDGIEYYMQFLDKIGSEYDEHYRIHFIAACYLDGIKSEWRETIVDGPYAKSTLLNALSKTYEPNDLFNNAGIKVVRPLDILSTDEIKSYLSGYTEEPSKYLYLN